LLYLENEEEVEIEEEKTAPPPPAEHQVGNCDTPVSPRVSLKKPNQEPSFYVNQSKHEHQNNLSEKEFTKHIYLKCHDQNN
jgi:hypothetical protein